MTDIEPYLYGAIFLAAILLVEGLFTLLRGTQRAQERAANRRARLQAKGLGTEETLLKLKRRRLTVGSEGRGKESLLRRPLAWLDRLLDESGLMVPTSRFLLIVVVMVLAILFAVSLLTGMPPELAALVALTTGISLPLLYLREKRRTRLAKLAEQLPEAIDMMVRSLRAGHPIRTAFTLVGREMSDPIGTEFGILVDELTYGLDLEEALRNLETRNDLPDLHYLAVTINLQHGTGGNLAEILANLAGVIRDRYRLFKKVRALSAEGRLSAIVIACVPFFVVGVMWFNSPKYYLDAAQHPAFFYLMGFAVFLYFVSMYAIHKIVNFRV